MVLLSIAAAGFAGAIVRFWLGGYVAQKIRTSFPWGTFVINITGAFALGLLVGIGTHAGVIPPHLRTATETGFLGSYTTFSSWNLETVRLVTSGKYLMAVTSVVLSTGSGLVAAGIGLALGRWL